MAGESQRGVGSDTALALHDLVDAARWHGDVIGDQVFRQAQGREEIFAEQFTGMDGGVFFS